MGPLAPHVDDFPGHRCHQIADNRDKIVLSLNLDLCNRKTVFFIGEGYSFYLAGEVGEHHYRPLKDFNLKKTHSNKSVVCRLRFEVLKISDCRLRIADFEGATYLIYQSEIRNLKSAIKFVPLRLYFIDDILFMIIKQG
jgi:hypothetical protein